MAGDDTYDGAQLLAELTEDEGKRVHGYVDTRGNITVGIGRNLTGSCLSDDEIMLLYDNDVAAAAGALDFSAPWWRSLPANAQRVMVNLCFNMGWATLSGFHLFLHAMQTGDWAGAAAQLKNSAWWAEVGERGPRMVARLLGTSTQSSGPTIAVEKPSTEGQKSVTGTQDSAT
jgi:lysozyme